MEKITTARQLKDSVDIHMLSEQIVALGKLSLTTTDVILAGASSWIATYLNELIFRNLVPENTNPVVYRTMRDEFTFRADEDDALIGGVFTFLGATTDLLVHLTGNEEYSVDPDAEPFG